MKSLQAYYRAVMDSTFKCPSCGIEIEISEALKHQIGESLLKDSEKKHKIELESIRKSAFEEAEKKALLSSELKLKDTINEKEELEKKKNEIQEQLLAQNKEVRSLKDKDNERQLEFDKKLNEARDKIQIDNEEKHKFEVLELQKKLSDTTKALEIAKNKTSQGSNQLAGEVGELEIERILKTAFPQDEIIPVGKGAFGADVLQIVKTPLGNNCGSILWESKRAKWNNDWISKLKNDARNAKADISILVSIELPEQAKSGYGDLEGVKLCSHSLVLPIAVTHRQALLDLARQKALVKNKEGKAENLLNYVTGHEFKQTVEVIIEEYNKTKTRINKERLYFQKSLSEREEEANNMLVGLATIVGSMHGKVGNSMPAIKGLELNEGTEEEQLSINSTSDK